MIESQNSEHRGALLLGAGFHILICGYRTTQDRQVYLVKGQGRVPGNNSEEEKTIYTEMFSVVLFIVWKLRNSQNDLQKIYDNTLHYSHTINKGKTRQKIGKCS